MEFEGDCGWWDGVGQGKAWKKLVWEGVFNSCLCWEKGANLIKNCEARVLSLITDQFTLQIAPKF